jgi:hypothetical protein
VLEFHSKKDELVNATFSFVVVSTNERRVIGPIHDNFVVVGVHVGVISLCGFVNGAQIMLLLEMLVHMVVVHIMLMFQTSLLFMLSL